MSSCVQKNQKQLNRKNPNLVTEFKPFPMDEAGKRLEQFNQSANSGVDR